MGKLCFSYLHNRNIQTKSLYFFTLFLFFSVLLLFFRYYPSPPFSVDSWSYYELAKTFDSEFYKITTWRQYQFNNGFGVSFPPLWPFLLWITDKIFSLGIYSGYFLNLSITVFTFLILVRICDKIFQEKSFGIMLFALLLFSNHYQDELVSGRSIPLSILLSLLMLEIILKDKLTFLEISKLGILSGLLILNRFDFLIPGLFFGLILFRLVKDKKVCIYYLFLLISILPWIFYSISHFGKLFVSDNSRTVISSTSVFVLDYYPEYLPTIIDHPIDWLIKSLKNIFKVLQNLLQASLPVVISIVFLSFYPKILTKRIRSNTINKDINKLILFFSVFLLQIATISLTGYGDKRYFSVFLLISMLLFLNYLYQIYGKNDFLYERLKYKSTILVGILCVTIFGNQLWSITVDVYYQKRAFNSNNISIENMVDLVRIARKKQEPRILFLTSQEKNTEIAKFGALTGITTFLKPTNLNDVNFVTFINQYRINMVIIDKSFKDKDMLNLVKYEQIFVSPQYVVVSLNEYNK